MRLSLCVLLVTLAFCCYEANAKVCPALISEIRGFFFEPEGFFNIHLQKFSPPREAAEASLKLKKWIDLLPFEDRKKLYNVVKKVAAICNQ